MARKYEIKFRPSLRDKLQDRRTFEERMEDAKREEDRIARLEETRLRTLKATRIKHAELKTKYIEYLGGKCKRCQQTFHHAAYDFHHRDPTVKDTEVSKMMSMQWHVVQRELDKCDLLCACCHRITHYEQHDVLRA